MLTQLHIENIAVISRADVHFQPGFNVFTGETGAGKTILISAIDAVLGERTSRDIIRTGEQKAKVSALFEGISIRARHTLEELGFSDDEGSVLISREIQANGKGSCRINGMPATVSILKAVASALIHIHGQRDSALLLASEQHLSLIDMFGVPEEVLATWRLQYETVSRLKQELKALRMDEAQKAQRIDMLTFQIQEIEAARLGDPSEEEALQSQRKMIRNSEKIRQALAEAYGVLRGSEEEAGLDVLMDRLVHASGEAAEFMETLEPGARRMEEIGYELNEFAMDIRTALDEFEFDPEELEILESRLDLIHRLQHKYGGEISEILRFQERAMEELESISGSERKTAELTAALEKESAQMDKLAEKLSKMRQKAAKQFVKQVEEELVFLDMPSVKLSVVRTQKEPSATGIDDMELYLTTNPGEEPKPLSRIASGGEISRIMLAIKNVLAEKDDVATLIFDEVDTGVSGRAAGKIGQKLGQVSGSRQVICVTHLAQVAAFADHHLLICKDVEKGRTFTRIASLAGDAVVSELARITSGDMLTEAALQNARDLHDYSRGLLKKDIT